MTAATAAATPARNGARVPPHNLAAEASLLGAMLLKAESTAAAADVGLRPDDFYKPAHGHIYAAIVDLDLAGQPTDPVTVADHLGRAGLLETVGGPAVLVSLQAATPATSNAGRYAQIVADHAQLRRIIGVAGEIAEMGYNLPDDVTGFSATVDTLVADVTGPRRLAARLEPIGQRLGDWLGDLERLTEDGAGTGTPTGWPDLDELLAGLQPGQLVTVAGRPGMGKSAWAGQLATNVAAVGRAVLLVSLEMTLHELLGRFVAASSRVDLKALRSGRITERDWQRISQGISALADIPLYVDDHADSTVASVRHSIRRLTARHDGIPPLVIVDYLQLVPGASRAENRQAEVSEVARGLKKLAMETRTPVVALAQLNRNVELRADKRPTLADLRESGEIENASDVVAFIYRDEYYRPDSPDKGVAEIIVAKQRNGPTDTVRLAYLAQHGTFATMAKGFL